MSLSHLLQIQALREALERSGRACMVADERHLLTVRQLKKEQTRADALEDKVRQLEDQLHDFELRKSEIEDENRRLRNLIGQAAQDKHCANSELRALLQEVHDLTPKKTSLGRRCDAA